MKKTLILFLLIPFLGMAQRNLLANQIAQVEITFDNFAGSDQFGSLYFIANNVFVKQNGNIKLEYNNIEKGRITRADVTNPLMIVLLYEDFNTVVLLDNQLNEIREIEFSILEDQVIVHAAGLAAQNRLWIFDSVMQRLMYYDLNRNELKSLATPFVNSILYYETSLNNFLWIDSAGIIYSCDVFGEVRTLGKMAEFDQVKFASNTALFFTDEGKLYFADLTKNETLPILNVGNSVSKFYYSDQILSIFTKKGITHYKIKLP